jgi:hypothetical protein
MCRIASLFLLQRLNGSISGDTCDFNNIETRAVIKFFLLQGKAPKEIHAILTETLGEHAPSYATVKNWVAQAPPPALWLIPTVPNNCCQKSRSLCFQGRWKRPYQRITVYMTNLLQILRNIFLPKLAKHSLSGPQSVIQVLFPCSQFWYSVQS